MIKEVYESVRKFVKTLENEKEKYVHNPKIDFTRLRKSRLIAAITPANRPHAVKKRNISSI